MKRLTIIEKMDYLEKSIEIRRDRMINLNIKEENGDYYDEANSVSGKIIQIRGNEEFRGHAFYLSNRYDWVIGKDSNGSACLVPLEKK